MGIGDLSRVNTNVQAMKSLSMLQKTNDRLATRQLRLSTGSKINQAEDDSAGYIISKKLETKVRGQAQALANIGDAKSMLTVTEGALTSLMDILQTMKEKAVQAANDTMGLDEREAINTQLEALTKEIHDVLNNTKFNGNQVISQNSTMSFSYQVGDTNATADKFSVSIGTTRVSTTTGSLFSAASIGSVLKNAGATATNWDITKASHARIALGGIDNAIKQVSKRLSTIGDSQKRLSFKMENLNTSMTNYEAARSRIADADFAKEQMEIVKLQILQQTGTASLAQANTAPQAVLSLMGN